MARIHKPQKYFYHICPLGMCQLLSLASKFHTHPSSPCFLMPEQVSASFISLLPATLRLALTKGGAGGMLGGRGRKDFVESASLPPCKPGPRLLYTGERFSGLPNSLQPVSSLCSQGVLLQHLRSCHAYSSLSPRDGSPSLQSSISPFG